MQVLAPVGSLRLQVTGPVGVAESFTPVTTAVKVIVPPMVCVPLDRSEIVGVA